MSLMKRLSLALWVLIVLLWFCVMPARSSYRQYLLYKESGTYQVIHGENNKEGSKEKEYESSRPSEKNEDRDAEGGQE